jgi:pimeloyl-ACP methyl ester carboxylesterase/DNA-binding SARP family transcriptional activator
MRGRFSLPFLHRNDHCLFYTVDAANDGSLSETIILIHPNITDHTIFELIVPLLTNKYNVIRYDLRGFGQSSRGAKEIYLETYVHDLLLLIENLNLQKIHLIGMGFGAQIAAKFTHYYSQYVERLVLISMPCNPPGIIDRIRTHRRKISHNGTYIPIDYILSTLISLPKNHPEAKKLKNLIGQTPPSLYFRIMDLSVSAFPIEDLVKIDKLTLILSGEDDKVFPSQYLAMNALYLPNCNYRSIPAAKSLLMIDQPYILSNSIIDFLEAKDTSVSIIHDPFLTSIEKEIRLYIQQVYQKGSQKYIESNMLKVDLLNTFRVYISGKEILKGWNQRFAKQILIFMLFHRSVTREQLCEALWPNLSLSQAKKNLRVYLSYAKKLIMNSDHSHSILIVDREHVYLSGHISCDALDFAEWLKTFTNESSTKKKEMLAQKILSSIKPGFLTAIYDPWFIEIRNEMENQIEETVIWLSSLYYEQGRKQESLKLVIQALSLLNENELLMDQMILFYNKMGDYKNRDEWVKRKQNYISSS